MTPEKEPIAWGEAVRLALLLAVSFGLDLTDEQVVMIVALAGIVIAAVQRGRVSPTSKQ